jgi:peptide/nickel transport system permease protein
LALFGIAAPRLMRSSMLDTLASEFVKFARVKGPPEPTLIWKHGARNAVLPVVSFAGILFADTTTQQIVIETVFAWPGVGQLNYTAVLNRDSPVVQGVVLMAGVIAISANLLTDILYTRLDPRIRHGG